MDNTQILQGKTILIVEDCESCRVLIEELLLETEVRLLFAYDGKDAILTYQKERYIDMVLMDIVLPEINGIEATKIIKSFRNDLPIVAVSASVFYHDKHSCVLAGCDSFIEKPISEKILFETIIKILSSEKNY